MRALPIIWKLLAKLKPCEGRGRRFAGSVSNPFVGTWLLLLLITIALLDTRPFVRTWLRLPEDGAVRLLPAILIARVIQAVPPVASTQLLMLALFLSHFCKVQVLSRIGPIVA